MQLLRTIWRFALLGFWITAADAVELKQNKFKVGTGGLVSVPLTVDNSGPAPIACVAQYAHWYSADVGTAATGTALRINLWFETASGTYVMLNPSQENLPVESLWCGIAGHAFETRTLLPLKRNANAEVTPVAVTCTPGPERLRCE